MHRSRSEIVHFLVSVAWRRRFLICVPLLLLPAVGFAVGMFAPRTYVTHMTLLVQEPAKLNPYLGDLAVGTRLQERMPVITSLVRNPSGLEDVALALGRISPDTPKPVRDDVIRKLSKGLTIQLIGTDLVELRLAGDTADVLELELAAIAARFIDKLTAPERESIAGTVEFLERQIDGRRPLLQAASQRLAEFRARNAAALPDARAADGARLAGLRDLLDERRRALAGATAALSALQATILNTNPLLDQIEKEVARLSGEVAHLRSRYTENHPALRAAQAELRSLEEQRAAVGSGSRPGDPPPSAVSASQAEPLRAAKAQQLSLQVEVAQLERAVTDAEAAAVQTDVQSDLARLESDLATEKELYDKLVKRYEMAQVSGALGSFEAGERVKIIAPPEHPIDVGPSSTVFLLAGIVGGLALGLGLAVTAEMGDDSMRRRDQVERITGLPVLARIARFAPDAAAAVDPDTPPMAAAPPVATPVAPEPRFSASVHPIKIKTS